KKPSDQQELSQVINDLTLAGTQSSLRQFNYKAGMPTRSELFCALPLVVTFEGDFLNVFNFLRSTEDMPRLTRVRNLSLKTKDSKTGKVQATLALNVYFSLD